MKRFWLFLLILALASPVFGQGDTLDYPQRFREVGKNQVLVYYSDPITDPTDTFWVPGISGTITAQDTIPAVYGINISQHRWIGFDVTTVAVDTTLDDSVLVSVYTGVYGHLDSVTEVLTFDSLGVLDGDAIGNKTLMWIDLYDPKHSETGFERYIWLHIVTDPSTYGVSDTVVTTIAPEKDLFAAGDSIHGWTATGGDDSWETEIDEAQGSINWNDYVSVVVKDSFLVIAMDQVELAANPGTIDSLVFFVVVTESLDVVTADSLRAGAVFGDTSDHYFGLFSDPVWGATQVPDEEGGAGTYDTLTFSLPLTPRGVAWTRSSIDSCLMVLHSVFIDTVAAGTAGMLKVPQVWARTYHSRTELFPPLELRTTVYLKD